MKINRRQLRRLILKEINYLNEGDPFDELDDETSGEKKKIDSSREQAIKFLKEAKDKKGREKRDLLTKYNISKHAQGKQKGKKAHKVVFEDGKSHIIVDDDISK